LLYLLNVLIVAIVLQSDALKQYQQQVQYENFYQTSVFTVSSEFKANYHWSWRAVMLMEDKHDTSCKTPLFPNIGMEFPMKY